MFSVPDGVGEGLSFVSLQVTRDLFWAVDENLPSFSSVQNPNVVPGQCGSIHGGLSKEKSKNISKTSHFQTLEKHVEILNPELFHKIMQSLGNMTNFR